MAINGDQVTRPGTPFLASFARSGDFGFLGPNLDKTSEKSRELRD
jgi:hypothetical protein